MAIEQSTSTPFGIDLPKSYVRVTYFTGDKTHVSYTVKTWATEEAEKSGKSFLSELNYSFIYKVGMGDMLVACYLDLLARPEFIGAISV